MGIEIRKIENAEEKRRICRVILEALPEWFGIPEAREEYVSESADKLFFAAMDGENPVGFLCLKETGRDTVELYVMGVLKARHRTGAGRALVEAAKRTAREAGYAFMAMSAATHQGTRELVQAIAARLAELPPVAVYEPEYVPRPPQIDTSEPLSIQQEDNTWLVEGPWLQRLMANINFSDYESRMYFDKMLRQSGLFDQLERMGIQDGDIVSMYNLEFEYQR